MSGQSIVIAILIIIVIVCYAVAACRVYIAIGHSDDQAAFDIYGYPLGTGIFALCTAIAFGFAMPEDDITLALSVLVGVTAVALSIGALATGTITH